jgi:hypothetical protein
MHALPRPTRGARKNILGRRRRRGVAGAAVVALLGAPVTLAADPAAEAADSGTRAAGTTSRSFRQTSPAPDGAPTARSLPGSELRVWLVTAGPGDAVWERYGHNAIRVLDTVTGRDVSYNWGIFDFDQVDFIPRFLQGRMLYMMAPFHTDSMIDAYARANRRVVLQELALSPAQKLALRDFADRNALPANRDYTYQYFLDNCSTRVRDVLDLVLGGALRARWGDVDTGRTYRWQIRRLMQVDPLVYTGQDLLLGAPTDRTLSVWEEMFIPMTLRERIREMSVPDGAGSERPLVIDEQEVAASTRPLPPEAPPGWLPLYVLIGLALGALLASGGSARVRASTPWRRAVLAVSVLWALIGGVAGTLLIALLFTDHLFSYGNENLFLFNPLLFAVAVLLPLSGRSEAWGRRARAAVLATTTLALLGLLWQLAPASVHANAIFFALALPPHLGLALAVLRAVAAGDGPDGRGHERSARV